MQLRTRVWEHGAAKHAPQHRDSGAWSKSCVSGPLSPAPAGAYRVRAQRRPLLQLVLAAGSYLSTSKARYGAALLCPAG